MTDLAEKRRESLVAARQVSNRVRRQQGEVKRALRSGEVNPFDLIEGNALEEIETVVQGMKVMPLVTAIPGIGKARAFDILNALDLKPETRMRVLDKDTRRELALLIRGAREAWAPPRIHPDD